MKRRSAIALMITIFFIMAISLSLGIALKQVKEARTEIQKQNFLLQTNVILEDVMNILKNSKELDAVMKENSQDGLYIFLSQASFIPFEHSGISIILEIQSARSMFNINSVVDAKGKVNKKRIDSLINYFSLFGVNVSYVEMLLDNISKSKEDTYYNTAIFDENPFLFRDYITSKKHIDDINSYYTKYYNENSLSKIDFEKLFYYSKDTTTKVDLNYATLDTWMLLLGCDAQKAESLSFGAGSYTKVDDLNLSSEEALSLSHFKTSFYEPFLDIRVEVKEGSLDAKIRFEYDMKTKKGSNFVYEI